ncbi:unnamed protein product [Colias eurytheme]|nr:unnamed protein product [Colias eurytheme]
MESPIKENPEIPRSDSTSSNQLFISEQLDLPDDTFRMSLDYITDIGENVTIGDRDVSIDSVKPDSNINTTPSTPVTPLTNKSPTLETDSQCLNQSPAITETPKLTDDLKESPRPVNSLKLSLAKIENDGFVKPSPLDVMSPAKMLQFEVDLTSSATPTMKRAAIDFNFFTENTFEEYFKDESNEKETGVAFKETPVIVKANTVRHEIGYGHIKEQRPATTEIITLYFGI